MWCGQTSPLDLPVKNLKSCSIVKIGTYAVVEHRREEGDNDETMCTAHSEGA